MEQFPKSNNKEDDPRRDDEYSEGSGAEPLEWEHEEKSSLEFFRDYRDEEVRRSEDFGCKEELPLRQQLTKAITSPEEAMTDIVCWPSYANSFFIIIVNSIIGLLLIGTIYPKFQFIGDSSSAALKYVTTQFMLQAVFFPTSAFIIWLIKSLCVHYLCSSETSWSFETAASVTAYSYIPRILLGLITAPLSWIFIPVFTVDVGSITDPVLFVSLLDREIADAIMLQWWLEFPFLLLALLWGAYLGSKGAYKGTYGK
ncbi:MAG: Yip1 family protein, partial [Candidatus Thorarchaeota archaeon]